MFRNMFCHTATIALGMLALSGVAHAADSACPANAPNPVTKQSENLVEVQVLSFPAKQGRPAASKAQPVIHPDQETPVKGGMKQVWNINASGGNTYLVECYYGESNKPVSFEVSRLKQCTGEATTKGTWNGFACE